MKIKLLTLVVATAVSGSFMGLAQAAQSSDSVDKQQMQKLLAKTDRLERELASLKVQLKQITPVGVNKSKKSKIASTTPQTTEEHISKILQATRYAHGFSVMTSPFLGQRDVYSLGSLIVNVPSTNADLHLLEQRQKLENYAVLHNEPVSPYALIDLSGGIEGQMSYSSRSSFITTVEAGVPASNSSKTDVDLTRVELDTIAELGPWVTGAMLLNYENGVPLSVADTPGSRVTNSRVKVDRAFITIGNLNRFPVFGSIGQVNVPFGNYFSYELSTPFTNTLGQTKARAVELSFNKWDLYGTVFAFRGDSYVSNSNTINNWGANLGYKLKPLNYLTTDVGVSYIANIADSKGMQNNTFGNKADIVAPPAGEPLDHRVPGLDAHIVLNMEPFTLASEYVTATKHFDALDLGYNGLGAKPRVWEIEGAYGFKLFGKNSNIAAGYNRSWEALGVQLPEHSYFGVFNTSIWPYTIETLEYRHDVNYGAGDRGYTWGGTYMASSHTQNVVTFQIGAYF